MAGPAMRRDKGKIVVGFDGIGCAPLRHVGSSSQARKSRNGDIRQAAVERIRAGVDVAGQRVSAGIGENASGIQANVGGLKKGPVARKSGVSLVDKLRAGPVFLNDHGMLTRLVGDISMKRKSEALHLIGIPAKPSVPSSQVMVGGKIVVDAPEIGVVIVGGVGGS